MEVVTELMSIGEPSSDFTAFYEVEYAPQVRRAFLLLNCAEQAHDVVADAFAEVLQRWDAIETAGPYLNRCVTNGCRTAGKKRSRDVLVGDDQDKKLTIAVADCPNNSGAANAEHASAEIGEILMTLPFRQRAAIVGRFYAGMSEAEIAESLSCRPGTVGSLIHRGLRQLRKALT